MVVDEGACGGVEECFEVAAWEVDYGSELSHGEGGAEVEEFAAEGEDGL